MLDPFRPYGYFREQERAASGRIVESAVILLTNKECPWRCLMCDLWQHTTTRSVPPGAIPAQVTYALRALASGLALHQVKLYNSGSFFDPAAIPTADYPAIAAAVSFAKHVVVESHPRLIGEKTLRFRDLLYGSNRGSNLRVDATPSSPRLRSSASVDAMPASPQVGSSVSLEVAMGLETVHPAILPRLNKKFTLAQFGDAAAFLRNERIAMRAFVLLQPPFLPKDECVEWAVKSAEFAFSCGATAVSLIPTRGGNGAMERLREAGEFTPPRLADLERALAAVLALRAGRVFADTWELKPFASCQHCFERRKQRLNEMNLTQQILPAVACENCGGD